MAALTKEKKILELNGDRVVPKLYDLAVKASTKILSGALVCIDATGYAINASEALGQTPIGVAQNTADNTSGNSGDLLVRVLAGVFKFVNGDSIAITELGKTAYIVDNQTVAKSDNSGARSVAGIIIRVDADGVYVLVGMTGGAALPMQAGTATLASGTVTVAGARLTANSRILVSRNTKGGGASISTDLEVPSASRNVGAKTFVINAVKADKSVDANDSSTVDWLIVG